MKRKILTSLLIGTLCLSMLSGCSSSKDVGSASAASGNTNTSAGELPDQEDSAVSDGLPQNAANVGTFQTTDINGDTFDQEMFKNYDLTLVNIFTTWCSPCVEELPELEKINQELGKKYNINVVGIVMDTVDENFDPASDQSEVIDKAKKLVEKAGVSYPLLIPDQTALNGLLAHIDSYPRTFFVDKDGNIVGETYEGSRGYDDWAKIVETELENLKNGNES